LAHNFGAESRLFAELNQGKYEEKLLANCQTVLFAAFAEDLSSLNQLLQFARGIPSDISWYKLKSIKKWQAL